MSKDGKIKVLYDFQMFSLQKYGGISRYYYELIKAYREDPDIEVVLGVQASNNYYLTSDSLIGPTLDTREFLELKKFLGGFDFPGRERLYKVYYKLFNTAYRRNREYSEKLLQEGNFDIVHPTYYFLPEYYEHKLEKPMVVTAYDLIHEIYPEYFDNSNDRTAKYTNISTSLAAKVLSISQSTKDDLIMFYGVPQDKIEVIPLAASINPKLISSGYSMQLPKKYLLYVGSRETYKNFGFFARVAEKLMRKHKDLYIVVAGGGELHQAELDLLDVLGIREKVVSIKAGDQDLAYAYSNALCFVFPSLYEGFGIPLIEAMNCDCPIACSDTRCFREVAQDAAEYFLPKDYESIHQALDKVVSSEQFRTTLVNNGKKLRGNYSFKKVAEQTKQVYMDVLSK